MPRLSTPTDEDNGSEGSSGRAAVEGAPPEETTARASIDDEDDERPDPVRLAILSVVLVVLAGVWLWVYLHPPPKPFYTDIPGIDLSGLTAPQREQVLKEANAMKCDCDMPCAFNVAECRHMEMTGCDVSLKLAVGIITRVTGKAPRRIDVPPSGAPQGGPSGAPHGSGAPASAAPAVASPAAK